MARMIAERADVLPEIAEVFREHGYDGASLSLITRRTGLGKGSLYHFFPGGKAAMAEAVLQDVDGWFSRHIFTPLQNGGPEAVENSLKATEEYFASGRRVCLVGVMALGASRDAFAERVQAYFTAWVEALAVALQRGGLTESQARNLAEEVVAGIQGGLVLARGLNDPGAFLRVTRQMRRRLADAFAQSLV
jgi:AcrR family transcriptional regulator